MRGLNRNDRRPDLDPSGRRADQSRRGQRVELVGNLGNPHRGESGIVRPPGVLAHPLDLGAVATPLGSDHQADAHLSSSLAAPPVARPTVAAELPLS